MLFLWSLEKNLQRASLVLSYPQEPVTLNQTTPATAFETSVLLYLKICRHMKSPFLYFKLSTGMNKNNTIKVPTTIQQPRWTREMARTPRAQASWTKSSRAQNYLTTMPITSGGWGTPCALWLKPLRMSVRLFVINVWESLQSYESVLTHHGVYSNNFKYMLSRLWFQKTVTNKIPIPSSSGWSWLHRSNSRLLPAALC